MVQRLKLGSLLGGLRLKPPAGVTQGVPGNGDALKRVISSRNIEHVRAAIVRRYGFEPPDLYIADLIDFVEELRRDDT